MDKFEYVTHTIFIEKSIFSSRSLDERFLNSELNKFGNEGWELVSIVNTQYSSSTDNIVLFFKRKKMET